MTAEYNFFTNELYQYYPGKGQNLSEKVIQILNKCHKDLTDDEKGIYQDIILPTQQQIKRALAERLKESGASKEDWREQLLTCYDTIIGKMAAEMLKEEETANDSGGLQAPPSISASPALVGQQFQEPVSNAYNEAKPKKSRKYIIHVNNIRMECINCPQHFIECIEIIKSGQCFFFG